MLDVNSQDQLVAALSKELGAVIAEKHGAAPEVVDPDASLTSFSLDSLAMVTLVARIEEALGIELEPELAFNYPTINALAGYIAAQGAQSDA